jgi:hypothetical protein
MRPFEHTVLRLARYYIAIISAVYNEKLQNLHRPPINLRD